MLDFEDYDTYMLLVEAGQKYAVFPSASLESEDFFRNLLAHYEGSLDPTSVVSWLEQEISHSFIALGEYPRWIQNPEWPLVGGKPMIFAGQIDLSVQAGGATAELFHDDTSLYVFIGRKVPPVVVMQQF
ncbi:MAG: hypothetical protein WBO46_21530 [Caldilineaceae bacterium]